MTTCPLLLGGRYQLDDRIGAGGMGEVWRATDSMLRRRVAVKLLRPELARADDHLALFRTEAQSAASVPHPCVVQVYDYCDGASGGQPYLVMELVDGPSLDELLEDGPLGPAFTMSIVAQTAQGLAAAHTAGLVHRDIKPQNLLVARNGQIKITDFGIARLNGSALTAGSGAMGTPAYLAPERGLGAAATPVADLYALGIVAYQCLTGRLPFTGEPLAVMLAHQNQPLPRLPRSVPAEVAGLVAALTAKAPQERPASAAQVAVQAARLQGSLPRRRGRPGFLAAFRAGNSQAPAAGAVRQPGNDRGGRTRARVAARAGLALASVGVIGLAGWTVAHDPHRSGLQQQLSGQPSTTAPGTHRPGRTALSRDGHTARGKDPAGAAPAPAHRAPRPAHSAKPVSSHKPKGSPAPSAGPGTPTPAPSATSPSPSPDPTPTAPSATPSVTPPSLTNRAPAPVPHRNP